MSHSKINTLQSEDLEILLSEEAMREKVKEWNVSYIEVRSGSFRLNKKIGRGIKPIRKTLEEPLNLKGLIKVKDLVQDIKGMSKDELIDKRTTLYGNTMNLVVERYNNFGGKGLEPSTQQNYQSKCNHIDRDFDGVPVKNLTHNMIESWALESKLQKDGVVKVLSHLEKALKMGCREDLISRFQLVGIDFDDIKGLVKQKETVTNHKPKKTRLSEKEVQKVEALDIELVKAEGLYPIWLSFQLQARNDGRRVGEVRCSAIDDIIVYKEQLKISLNRACSISGFKTTKIAKGVAHSIDVYRYNYDILSMLIEDAKQYDPQEIEVFEKEVLVRKDKVNFLVVNPKTREIYTEYEYRKEIKRLQSLAGIKEPIPPKYLRHTFASLTNEAGVKEDVIAKQLTHCNDTKTKRHYIQIVHQDTTEEVKEVEYKMTKHMKFHEPNLSVKNVSLRMNKFFSKLLKRNSIPSCLRDNLTQYPN